MTKESEDQRKKKAEEVVELFNKGAEEHRLSDRIDPETLKAYHDYSNLNSEDFLYAIGGSASSQNSRKEAFEAFLNSPAKDQPVSKTSISKYRTEWINFGARSNMPEQIEEADSAISMLQQFTITEEPDKKPEEYPDVQALTFWEAHWQRVMSYKIVTQEIEVIANAALEFISKQRAKILPPQNPQFPTINPN